MIDRILPDDHYFRFICTTSILYGIVQHIAFLVSPYHLSFKQGGGHGGSHPHLVHEFIRSIIEERKPANRNLCP
ncbi:hypothetical protein [Blautia pseudococcoides]|uniref:hypothetical protein n=1 Tax=Blautia pseudococcoides TaxID=1796616 RepID=UPI002ED58E44